MQAANYVPSVLCNNNDKSSVNMNTAHALLIISYTERKTCFGAIKSQRFLIIGCQVQLRLPFDCCCSCVNERLAKKNIIRIEQRESKRNLHFLWLIRNTAAVSVVRNKCYRCQIKLQYILALICVKRYFPADCANSTSTGATSTTNQFLFILVVFVCRAKIW